MAEPIPPSSPDPGASPDSKTGEAAQRRASERSPKGGPKRTSRRGSLGSLFGIVIMDLVGFGVVIPILPFYTNSLSIGGADAAGVASTGVHVDASVLGWLLTCYALMQFVFAPIWGRLSDRIGRRPVMLVTIAGTSVALLLMGLADSLTGLFAARLLGGLFGANISVASAYITDVTSNEERTRFMGLLGASFGLGFILGPAIGGLLAPYGYEVPMFFAAGLAAINFFVALAYLQEPEPDTAVADEAAQAAHDRVEPAVPAGPAVGRRKGWFRPLPQGKVLLLCVAYFIFVFGISQLETVFAFFMLDRFGWDARQVAFIMVMMGVITAGIQGGAIRRLAKVFGERWLLIFGTLLLAPSLALVPFCHGIALLLVPLAVSAVGRGLVHPSLLSLVSSAAGPRERGQVMGTFQSSASLARVLGPLAAGSLYDLRIALPFWLGGILMLVVLGIGFVLKRLAARELARSEGAAGSTG